MATCTTTYCNDPLGEHTVTDCNDISLGGVPALLVIECGYEIANLDDDTEYNALVAAGNAALISNIKFSIEAPSAVEIDSPIACQPPQVINYERSATLMDSNITDENVNDFYDNILNGRPFGGVVYYECSTGKVTYINSAIRFSGGRVVPDNNKENQRFEVTAKWEELSEPTRSDAPPSFFTS